jgi:DNA-binding MarR family transcriptional regulator
MAPREPRPRRPTAGPDLEVGEALFGLFKAVWLRGQFACRDAGITLPQGRVLLTISRGGPIAPSRIARDLGLSRQALSSAMAHLEREGLVARVRDGGDRRRVYLSFTPKGRERLRALSAGLHMVHRRVNGLFDSGERPRVVASLTAMTRAIGPTPEDAPLRCPACRRGRARSGASG